MNQVLQTVAVVATSLWVGTLFCLGLIVAPYLFILAARNSPSVPNTGVAADLIGPLLYSADVTSIIVGIGLCLALAYLRRQGVAPLGGRVFLTEVFIVVAMGSAALNYWRYAPLLKDLQSRLSDRYGAFHLADRADPLFLQFDALHHTSTTLFLVGLAAAMVCLVCVTRFAVRPSGTVTAAG